MREKIDGFLKKLNNTAFDVATGPIVLIAFGIPAVMGIAGVAICVFAVRKLIRMSKEKQAEEDDIE